MESVAQSNNLKLYNNIINSKKATPDEIGDFDTFNTLLKDSANAEKLYNNLIKLGRFSQDELGTKDEFFANIDPIQSVQPVQDSGVKTMNSSAQPQEREKGFWNTWLGDAAEKLGEGTAWMGEGIARMANLPVKMFANSLANKEELDPVKKVAFSKIFTSQVPLAGQLEMSADELKKVQKRLADKSDRYQGKDFSQLWKEGDRTGAIGQIMLEATRSLPISITAGLTGGAGLGLIGGISAGQKYEELSDVTQPGKQATSKEWDDYLSRMDMGEFAKLSNAILSGASESGSEYLGSVPVIGWLGRVYQKVGKKGLNDAVKNGVKTTVEKLFDKYGLLAAPIVEGIEEYSNQVAQNTVDYITGARTDFKPFENAGKAFIYGAGGGAQFSAAALPGVIANQFQSSQQPSVNNQVVPENQVPQPDPDQHRNALINQMRSEMQNVAHESGNIVTVMDDFGNTLFVKSGDLDDPSGLVQVVDKTGQPAGNNGFMHVSKIREHAAMPIEQALQERIPMIDGMIRDEKLPKVGTVITYQDKPFTITQDLGESFLLADEKGETIEALKDEFLPKEETALQSDHVPVSKHIITEQIGKQTYDFTENEDGSLTLVANDKMPAEKVLPVLEKEFANNPAWEVVAEKEQVEVPAQSRFQQPTLQTVVKSIQIRPKTQQNATPAPGGDTNMSGNKVNPEMQAQVEAETKPSYQFNGKDVSRDYLQGIIEDAQSKDDLVGLSYQNDKDIDALLSKKFPEPKTIYRIGKKEVSKDRALARIDIAKTPQQLKELVIENDPEMQQAYQAKMNQLSPTAQAPVQIPVQEESGIQASTPVNAPVPSKPKVVKPAKFTDEQIRQQAYMKLTGKTSMDKMDQSLANLIPTDVVQKVNSGQITKGEADAFMNILTKGVKKSKKSQSTPESRARIQKAKDVQPQTIEQVIAQYLLSGKRINTEDVKKELIGRNRDGSLRSNAELRQRIWMIANNAPSIDDLLVKNGILAGTEFEKQAMDDPTMFRNAVIDVISSMPTRTLLADYLLSANEQQNEDPGFEERNAFLGKQDIEQDIDDTEETDERLELENWLGQEEEITDNDLDTIFGNNNDNDVPLLNAQQDGKEQSIPDSRQDDDNSPSEGREVGQNTDGRDQGDAVRPTVASQEQEEPDYGAFKQQIDALRAERSRILSEKQKKSAQLNSRNGIFGDVKADANDMFAGQGFDPSQIPVALKQYDDQVSAIDREIERIKQRAITGAKEAAGQQEIEITGNNLKNNSEKFTDNVSVRFDNQPIKNSQNDESLQKNQQNEKPTEKVGQDQQPEQGENTPKEVQGEGKRKGLEKEVKTPLEKVLEQADARIKIKDEERKVNAFPSDAQKEAGNYQKGHVKIQGFDISIENPKGSMRSGTDPSGKKWEQKLNNSYGYFRRTEGYDGDQIDVFLGNNPANEKVFVVDQNKPGTDEFDESKVMLGFDNAEQAKTAYMSNYEPGWTGFRAITEVPVEQFREWLHDGAKQRKPFSEYKNTPEPAKTAQSDQPGVETETKPSETAASENNRIFEEPNNQVNEGQTKYNTVQNRKENEESISGREHLGENERDNVPDRGDREIYNPKTEKGRVYKKVKELVDTYKVKDLTPEEFSYWYNKLIDISISPKYKVRGNNETTLALGVYERLPYKIRYRKVSPIGYYSTVENALDQIKQEKGTDDQFKSMLLKNGAKQAEMDWMGWDDQFPDAGQKVSKEDIQNWIDQNRIEVEEKVVGYNKQNTFVFEDKWGNYELRTPNEDVITHIKKTDTVSLSEEEIHDILLNKAKDENKLGRYYKYSLPGGINYNELLLTMPDRYKVLRDKVNMEVETPEELQEFERLDRQIKETEPDFKSSHFEEPNILAHVRFDERTDQNGDRVLFIEELQSDWAQKGRQHGFKQQTATKESVSQELYQKSYSELSDEDQNSVDFELEGRQTINKGFVPNMPFKQTDQWLNLAFRRMMRYAAENGFDRIAWTPGEIQAERYDLSKQLDKITVTKKDGQYSVSGKRGSDVLSFGEHSEDKLADVIGKELAERAINETKDYPTASFEGERLVIGGEGMKSFYDKIVPSAASKLGSKFGSRVANIEIDLNDGDQSMDREVPMSVPSSGILKVQSIPVTSKMKESVIQGVPLYKQGEGKAGDTKEIQSAIEKLDYRTNKPGRTVFVNSMEDLPAEVQNDPNFQPDKFVATTVNGKTYINLNRVGSKDEAIAIWVHENGIHGGLSNILSSFNREIFGERMYDSFQSIAKTNPEFKSIVDYVLRDYQGQSKSVQGEEMAAFLAEKIVNEEDLTAPEKTAWRKVVDYFRNLIRKLFKFDSSLLSEREIGEIIHEVVQSNFEKPTESGTFTQENLSDEHQGQQILSANESQGRKRDEGRSRNAEIARRLGIYRQADRRELQSTWADKPEQEKALKAYAEQEGIWLNERQIAENAARRIPSGAEADVYLDKDGKNVTKIINYAQYSDTPEEFFTNRIQAFNDLFPGTAYSIIGFTETNKGFSFVVSQPFIRGKELQKLTISPETLDEQQERVAKFMEEGFGMEPAGLDAFENDTYLVQDLHLKNVIEGEDGNLYVIDAITSKKKQDIRYRKSDAKKPKTLESLLFTTAGERYREGLKEKRNWKQTLQGFRDYTQEKDGPIRRWQDEMVKMGAKLKENANPFRDKKLAPGRLQTLSKEFETKMEPVLKTIAKIVKTGISMEWIEPYLIAKHTPEVNAKIRAQKLEEFKNKSFNLTRWIEKNDPTEIELQEKIAELRQKEMYPSEDEIAEMEESLADVDFAGILPLNEDRDGNIIDKKFENDPDGFANALAKDFEGMVDSKLLTELHDNLKIATDAILDAQVNSKMITQKQADDYRSMYQNYVPLRGWREDAAKYYTYTKGKAGQGSSVKHAQGRSSLAESPLSYIFKLGYKSLAEQVENEVRESLLRFIANNYSPEFREMYKVKSAYFVKDGIDPETGEDVWRITSYRPSKEALESGNAVSEFYYDHMKLRTYSHALEHEVVVHTKDGDIVVVFDRRYPDSLPVAHAFNNQNVMFNLPGGDAENANILNMIAQHKIPALKIKGRRLTPSMSLREFTNWMKSMFTQFNLKFPITNYPRDFGESNYDSYILFGHGIPLKLNKRAYLAIDKYLRNKTDKSGLRPEVNNFYENGGTTGYTHELTPQEYEAKIAKEVRLLLKEGKFHPAKKALSDWLTRYNQRFEDSVRFAVYLNARAEGLSIKDACYRSRNATVDFNIRGKGSPWMGTIWGFFEVAVNSLAKNSDYFYRYGPAARKRAIQLAAAHVIVGFMEAMLNDWAYSDGDDDKDDDYYNRSRWMRHNYLNIPLPGDTKLYVPIALSQFWRGFKGMGAMFYDYFIGQRGKLSAGEAIAGIGLNFVDSLFPVPITSVYQNGEIHPIAPFVPLILKPWYEIEQNRNFMGQQIYKKPFTTKQEQDIADSSLYKDNVNTAYKFFTDLLARTTWKDNDSKYYLNKKGERKKIEGIAGILDLNPSKIEHVVSGYLGGTGDFVSDIITTAGQLINPDEDFDFKNAPFLNAFIRKTPEAKWNIIREYNQLKDYIEGMDTQESNYKKMAKSGDKEGLEKFVTLKSNKYDQSYKILLDLYEENISRQAKYVNYMTGDGSDKVIELMKEAIDQINELKFKNKDQ